MAAPVVAAVSSADGTSNYTVARPAGTADGDLLIGIVASDWNTLANNNITTGIWTDLTTSDYDGGSNQMHVALKAKIAASEPATYTVSIGGGADSAAAILRVTGHDGTPVIVQVAPTVVSAGSGAINAPSLVPSGADDLLICIGVVDGANGGGTLTWTVTGAGLTEQVDRQSNTWTSLVVGSLASPSSPSGTKTLVTSPTNHNKGAACTISIKSASGGGTTQDVDASLANTATVTATVAADRPTTASATATAAATSTAAVTRPTDASLTGAVTATAAGVVARPVAASVTTTAAVSADATVDTADRNVDATVAATAATTATAAATKPAAAVTAVTAGVSAAAAASKPTAGTATVTATVTGEAAATKPVGVSLGAAANITADATVGLAPVTVQATRNTAAGITATATREAAASATVPVTVDVEAAASVVRAASATLTVAVDIGSTLLKTTSATAAVTTAAVVTASATATPPVTRGASLLLARTAASGSPGGRGAATGSLLDRTVPTSRGDT